MTELDEKLVPKALELLNRFGMSTSYLSVAIGGDPLEGDFTETETSYSVKISPPKPITEYVTSETYQEGDVSTIIAASGLSFTPVINDRITIGSKNHEVISVQPVYSGDEIAIYKLGLRSS